MLFKDRLDAGELLAQKLLKYKDNKDVVVLGLPRGGVVTAAPIAHTLHAPLDCIIVRKIGSPSNPELAVGALTAGGTIYLNKPLMESMGLSIDSIVPNMEEAKKEALRRDQLYRTGKKPLDLKDKIVILVDDGIATGATVRAALDSLKNQGVQKIIVAVPVAAYDVAEEIKNQDVEFVVLDTPENLWGISQCYQEFEQVTDDEVVELLG